MTSPSNANAERGPVATAADASPVQTRAAQKVAEHDAHGAPPETLQSVTPAKCGEGEAQRASIERPLYLPKEFPDHAPLPPGGGNWLRPSGEDDWEDTTEITALPSAPEPHPSPAPRVAATPAQSQTRPAVSHTYVGLGMGMAASLTPMAMADGAANANAARKKRPA